MARLPCKLGTLVYVGGPEKVVDEINADVEGATVVGNELSLLTLCDCCEDETASKLATITDEGAIESDGNGEIDGASDEEDDNDAEIGDCGTATTVVDANKLDEPSSDDNNDDTAVAPLNVPLSGTDGATELKEEAAAAKGDDDDDDEDEDGPTVVVAITDVNVAVDAAVALSVGKVNCLEKDIVELLDEGAKVKGGFPGPLPIAGTEPTCLPAVWVVEPTSVVNEEIAECEDAEADVMGGSEDDCVANKTRSAGAEKVDEEVPAEVDDCSEMVD
ncbi:MAG: hypothetical protein M1830_007155 [Pleopsidium flavum]|nr:MAG: hypothetical protein M1830_007155 [Pleopsidium flavum]